MFFALYKRRFHSLLRRPTYKKTVMTMPADKQPDAHVLTLPSNTLSHRDSVFINDPKVNLNATKEPQKSKNPSLKVDSFVRHLSSSEKKTKKGDNSNKSHNVDGGDDDDVDGGDDDDVDDNNDDDDDSTNKNNNNNNLNYNNHDNNRDANEDIKNVDGSCGKSRKNMEESKNKEEKRMERKTMIRYYKVSDVDDTTADDVRNTSSRNKSKLVDLTDYGDVSRVVNTRLNQQNMPGFDKNVCTNNNKITNNNNKNTTNNNTIYNNTTYNNNGSFTRNNGSFTRNNGSITRNNGSINNNNSNSVSVFEPGFLSVLEEIQVTYLGQEWCPINQDSLDYYQFNQVMLSYLI